MRNLGDPKFRDDLFDNSAGDWAQTYQDEHFQQRSLRQEGPIYCETLMTVHRSTNISAAIDLICGPWDWWKHGRITDFATNEDGSSDQILSPVWWFITRVGLHILPAVEAPDLEGRRVPLLLSGHFTGWSSMDVYLSRESDAMIIRGRFHGVGYNVLGIPEKVAQGLHLEAESGTMPPPFPKGTGWVGLLHRLEGRSSSEKALTAR